MSWRDKVDKWEERKRQAEEAQRQRELQEHQARFRCHICDKASEGPVEYQTIAPIGIETDWDTPTGLTECSHCAKLTCDEHIHKCSRCAKLTCDEHIYKGICQHCAERLY